jgi:phospholipid/cholesterol/gamma-HCH transport system substrate-binding protein
MKIGIMAVVGIVLLVLGFNFLKGKNLFTKKRLIYAKYQDVQGLAKANPVVINGLQVGRIEDLDGGKAMKQIVVTISLNKDVNIPDNSLAVINPSILGGSATLEIQLGNSANYLKYGDTIMTSLSGGAFDQALKAINPVLYEMRLAVKALDSTLQIINSVIDPTAKKNLRSMIANLNTTTASFTVSSASLQKILNTQTGALAATLENMKKFTGNLNTNNQKLDSIFDNAKIISTKLAEMDFKKTLDTLNVVLDNFKTASEKINSKDGSIGLLLNDTKLYDNLQSTANKLNILLDDIRVHPRRYVNVSVFGKKDKGNYITAPLKDDTTH